MTQPQLATPYVETCIRRDIDKMMLHPVDLQPYIDKMGKENYLAQKEELYQHHKIIRING